MSAFLGCHVSKWKCGCICTVATSELIRTDEEERNALYAEAEEHGLDLFILNAQAEWDAIKWKWQCGKPADECNRQQYEATEEATTGGKS